MLATPALWTAFAVMTPLMLFTAWHDIKYLRIPNWIPVTTVAVYVVTGIWGLPFDVFLWGLGAGVITLLVFFGLYVLAHSVGIGKIGGGDVKLLSALVPFVFLHDAVNALIIYTISVFTVAFGILIIWGFRKKTTGLASLDQRGKKVAQVASPFGVALAFTTIFYLGSHLRQVMG